MLLHIPHCFTPDLLYLLMEMGHGEELLICDANFPYRSVGRTAEEPVHITGVTVDELLRLVLRFFPLDQTDEKAAVVMEAAKESDIYGHFTEILPPESGSIEAVPRFEFYRRAKSAVGIVMTSDTVKGGNILIKKGVVKDESL